VITSYAVLLQENQILQQIVDFADFHKVQRFWQYSLYSQIMQQHVAVVHKLQAILSHQKM